MGGAEKRGPIGYSGNAAEIDRGTLNRSRSRSPSVVGINKMRGSDPRYFEEVKRGTREFVEDRKQNVRILVERQKNGLYHWLIETLDGNQMCEGVHDPETQFTAEMCIDKTSDVAIKALEEEVEVAKSKAKQGPAGPEKVRREVIVIVKHDWLSKIALKKWGDAHAWKQYLRTTDKTLQERRSRRVSFDPDRIYPGDTFEVIGGWRNGQG